MLEDSRQYAFEVDKDIRIPEAQHRIAGCFECLGPVRVLGYLIGMLAAVALYDQLGIGASEVGDLACNCHLTLKLQTIQPSTA